MFFEDRPINIAKVDSAEILAKQLCNMWTLCTGFELPVQGTTGALFINDMTSEDGAQEYAVSTNKSPALNGKAIQFESITFSTNERQNLKLIRLAVDIITGKEPRTFERLVPVNSHPKETCYLCQ